MMIILFGDFCDLEYIFGKTNLYFHETIM